MKIPIAFFLVVLSINENSFEITSTTLSQKQRIKILKEKINKEIYIKRNTKSLYPPDAKDSSLEDYEYVQNDKSPITPILDSDIRKINEKFKLRSLKNRISPVNESINKTKFKVTDNNLRSKTKLRKKEKIVRIKKPLEIFYRRIYNKNLINQKLEWVHCQDMVTPLLTGAKVNFSNPKRLSAKDSSVIRFIQLLNVNTSTYNKDDIYSILYQISNLQLRLFQWDVTPLNSLFNIVMKERRHTFGNLKRGIHELFKNWHLDISNTSTLLRQARLFRPPCIDVSTFDGSTKSPKHTLYPKKNKKGTTPCDDDVDCDD